MGKAQSKRSVDITTEIKKGAEDEITEKMEKIEDLDKKEVVNGDATLQKKSDLEKKESDERENDKDMTTEKNVDVQASVSTGVPNSVDTPKEEGGSTTAEEISPLAEECIKKSKKEKVKKKWSFRSISFGKKDKQKPSKGEDVVESETTITNGAETDEKSSKEPEETQIEKLVDKVEEKTTEYRENGNATEEELNGVEHNEVQQSEEKSNNLTSNLTNNTITETYAPVQIETAVQASEISEKTEITTSTTTTNNENKIFDDNTTVESPKKGEEKLNATEQESQTKDVIITSMGASTEKTNILADASNESSVSTNGEIVEPIHQNGDNIKSGHEVIEQSKAQIEVNSNTDNKVFADTLNSFPSTYVNPCVQNRIQNLNEPNANFGENLKIVNDKLILQISSADIGEVECPVITSLISAPINTIEDIDGNNKQIEKVDLWPTKIVETEKSSIVKKTNDEPSPPPLPIFPPPSQVSVFAFTNDEESVEDCLATSSSEPIINSLDNKENKEIPLQLEVLTGKGNLKDDITEFNERHEKTNIYDISQYDPVAIHIEIKNKKVNIESIEEETSCTNKSLLEYPMSSNSALDEWKTEEEVSVATAVIDEITEKAAEIVSCQLENYKIIQEQLLQKSDITTKINKKNLNEKIEEEKNVDHEVLNDEYIKDGEHEDEKKAKSLLESTVILELNENTIHESSLKLSACDSIQQAQNEMISLNKSENPIIKGFGDAKDIKDNIAVAEITKDLSVTCE